MLTKSSPLETQNKKPKCDSNMICVWFYIGFCMVLCMYNYVYIYILVLVWFYIGFCEMVCDKKLDKTAQRNAIMQHMHFIVPM